MSGKTDITSNTRPCWAQLRGCPAFLCEDTIQATKQSVQKDLDKVTFEQWLKILAAQVTWLQSVCLFSVSWMHIQSYPESPKREGRGFMMQNLGLWLVSVQSTRVTKNNSSQASLCVLRTPLFRTSQAEQLSTERLFCEMEFFCRMLCFWWLLLKYPIFFSIHLFVRINFPNSFPFQNYSATYFTNPIN